MISKIEASLSRLNTSIPSPQVGGPVSRSSAEAKKSIGEVPPEIVDPKQYPHLAALATQYGVLARIRRKLVQLSGREGKIVLAKNTIGAADNKGLVYVGVDFLSQQQENPAILAGVMAHEWGHLCSNMAKYGNFDHLSWEELFEIRRDEEAAADAFAGRMMPLMGYSVEPIIQFLLKGQDKLGSHKYYNPQTRAEIIRRAAQTTLQRQNFSRKLFQSSVYSNPYTSVLFVA
ncbi:MAG: hypothetical protein JNK65_01855 [Deltaproteobacteria bacterium]|nr:hypothetical protein [Deltaproteobacteria bacterium]